MVKIIKQGRTRLNYTKTIYKITCPECGCIFECEVGDFKSSERHLGDPSDCKIMGSLAGDRTINCPTCDTELHTLKTGYTTREEVIKTSEDN